MNRQEREDPTSPLPSFLVAFRNNGMGDQICFDTRRPDADGEYPIVFWNHALSPEENMAGLDQIAENFAAWLTMEVEAAS